MKKILYLVFLLLCTTGARAQGLEKFYSPTRNWEPIENLSYEEILVAVESDTLSTLLFKPKVIPKALVVYFHGAGGNASHTARYIEPLVNDGFLVYVPDFRGNGRSTGQMNHHNIASDAQIVFDGLLLRDEVQGLPVIVHGASMGTQVAVHLTAHNQDKIHALVLESPVASFTDIAIAFSPAEQHDMIRMYVESPYSAKENIRDIPGVPLYLIHSREDKVVPYQHGETVYNNAPGPKEMWIYQGNHVDAAFLHRDEYLERYNRLLEN